MYCLSSIRGLANIECGSSIVLTGYVRNCSRDYFLTIMIINRMLRKVMVIQLTCLRRVTVQPPNPPPVILLPYTPGTSSAASTSWSSSGQDTSKSSLIMLSVSICICLNWAWDFNLSEVSRAGKPDSLWEKTESLFSRTPFTSKKHDCPPSIFQTFHNLLSQERQQRLMS